jgi:hypothetical protein
MLDRTTSVPHGRERSPRPSTVFFYGKYHAKAMALVGKASRDELASTEVAPFLMAA